MPKTEITPRDKARLALLWRGHVIGRITRMFAGRTLKQAAVDKLLRRGWITLDDCCAQYVISDDGCKAYLENVK